MVIGFTNQFQTSNPIFVELSRKVSQETINKIENKLSKFISAYGERTNGDYSDFNIVIAIEKVMNSTGLKWQFLRPDVFITY